MIMKTTNKYCKPLPSLPLKYRQYKQNINASTILQILRDYRYKIDAQVMNYSGKVIGITAFELITDTEPVFIPTFPSSIVNKLKRIFINDVEWLSYEETRDKL